jgi:hypothetical protein
VFLDHPEEVIGHGYDVCALLLHEQLELLAQFWRYVGFDLRGSFLAHVRKKKPRDG